MATEELAVFSVWTRVGLASCAPRGPREESWHDAEGLKDANEKLVVGIYSEGTQKRLQGP